MRVKIKLIGIGLGNPKHITAEAIEALKLCDLIIIGDKKETKSELANLKREITLAQIDSEKTEISSFSFPERKVSEPFYKDAVLDWHSDIANLWVDLILKFLKKNFNKQTIIGIPVWGDPSLYDSTLRIGEKVRKKIENSSIQMISGISSPHVLASSFGIPFNKIGEPVMITTGRKLREDGWPKGVSTIFVMLDGDCSFGSLAEQNLYIWWGAYLGLDRETLLEGKLEDIKNNIIELRQKLRKKFGWIMDIYKIQQIIDKEI